MVELHVCPKCNQASGWKGPPYQGVRWAKLKAIAQLKEKITIENGKKSLDAVQSCQRKLQSSIFRTLNI